MKYDMTEHSKISLRPDHLLLSYISIEMTILDNMFQMKKRQAMSPLGTGYRVPQVKLDLNMTTQQM